MAQNTWRTLVLVVMLGSVLGACRQPSAPPATAPPGPAASASPRIEASAEAAGLRWRECKVGPDGEDWAQTEACFEHPSVVWDDTDRANAGERTQHGYRLRTGQDVYETYEHETFVPNLNLYTLTRNGRLQKLILGRFTAYSPDLGLTNLAGNTAWTFDDGHVATIVYDGADLRSTYSLDAAYAPYALANKLIFVGRWADHYFVVYDGQQVGPTFDQILIAHCCEPAMYSARGGGARYTFWGQQGDERYMVEIVAG